MKNLALASIAFASTLPLIAQSPAPNLRGVWQGTLDGLPGVTLTLANDTGEFGGTVVFYGQNGRDHKIVVVQAHNLLNPQLEGNTLNFRIKFGGDRTGYARVTVVFNGDKAQLHCLDCGPDSPITELTRQVD